MTIEKTFADGSWEKTLSNPQYIGTHPTTTAIVEGAFTIGNEASALIISGGTISMRGNIENVAEIVFWHLNKEHAPGLKTMIISDTMRCCFDKKGISIEFVGNKKPEFFDELADTVKRFSELRAFS